MKDKLSNLTSRSWSVDLKYRMFKLKQAIVGWIIYFLLADMKSLTDRLDRFVRRIISAHIWKGWKKISNVLKPLKG